MSSWIDSLDPEVKNVLIDVSRQETVHFAAWAPRGRVADPTADLPSVSAGTAGWSPAERHLVTAFREELALLLQHAFYAKVAQEERTRVLAPVTPPGWSCDKDALARRATRLHSARREPAELIVTLLDQLSENDAPIQPTLQQLADAAAQLVDDHVTRLLRAGARNFEHDGRGAVTLALHVAESTSSANVRSAAWSIVALGRSLSDDAPGAVAAYLASLRDDPSDVVMAVNLLLCSVRADDEAEAREACSLVSSLSPDERSVHSLIEVSRRRADLGERRYPREQRVLRALDGSVGAAAQALIDGIFQD